MVSILIATKLFEDASVTFSSSQLAAICVDCSSSPVNIFQGLLEMPRSGLLILNFFPCETRTQIKYNPQFFFHILFYVYKLFALHVFKSVCSAWAGQKLSLETLEMELQQLWVTIWVLGTKLVLCKNSKYFSPSFLPFFFFCFLLLFYLRQGIYIILELTVSSFQVLGLKTCTITPSLASILLTSPNLKTNPTEAVVVVP